MFTTQQNYLVGFFVSKISNFVVYTDLNDVEIKSRKEKVIVYKGEDCIDQDQTLNLSIEK